MQRERSLKSDPFLGFGTGQSDGTGNLIQHEGPGLFIREILRISYLNVYMR